MYTYTCLLSGAEAPWVPILSHKERDSKRPEQHVCTCVLRLQVYILRIQWYPTQYVYPLSLVFKYTVGRSKEDGNKRPNVAG